MIATITQTDNLGAGSVDAISGKKKMRNIAKNWCVTFALSGDKKRRGYYISTGNRRTAERLGCKKQRMVKCRLAAIAQCGRRCTRKYCDSGSLQYSWRLPIKIPWTMLDVAGYYWSDGACTTFVFRRWLMILRLNTSVLLRTTVRPAGCPWVATESTMLPKIVPMVALYANHIIEAGFA